MSDNRPSIAELQREALRWPTDWSPALGEEGEWQGFWWCKDHNGAEERVSADVDEDYASEFSALVARLINDQPALLGIATAALRIQAWHDDEDRSQAELEARLDELMAATRKVRP
jgi:uncharacterized protein YktB (UPF0637 family)